MRAGLRVTTIIGGTLLLTACSATFQIDVPDPELIKACVKDPRSSYSAKDKHPKLPLFKTDRPAGTFITNKQLTPGSADVTAAAFDYSQLYSGKKFGVLNQPKIMGTPEMHSYIATNFKVLVANGNDLWNNPVHQELMTTYNELVIGTPPAQKDIDADALKAYRDASKDFALRGGWLVYSLVAFDLIKSTQDKNAKAALTIKAIGSAYTHVYLKAYFRNGRFVQAKWDLGNPFLKAFEALPPEVKKKLAEIIPQKKFEEFNKKLEELLSGEIGKIADSGFVSRGGDALAIPPITASFDSKKQNRFSISSFEADTVGADIVRITFEALGDAISEIPAVSEATGVVSEVLIEAGKQLPDAGEIKINGASPPKVEDVMGNVERLSGKAHGMVSSSVGTAIRGINIASLNNEALAKILESTAGTIARKVTERMAWCWYASIPAEENKNPFSPLAQPHKWNSVKLKLNY